MGLSSWLFWILRINWWTGYEELCHSIFLVYINRNYYARPFCGNPLKLHYLVKLILSRLALWLTAPKRLCAFVRGLHGTPRPLRISPPALSWNAAFGCKWWLWCFLVMFFFLFSTRKIVGNLFPILMSRYLLNFFDMFWSSLFGFVFFLCDLCWFLTSLGNHQGIMSLSTISTISTNLCGYL